jgi:ATP-dependent RNA helicase RhlE
MTFQELGLSESVLKALALKNYTTPTPIQMQAIPPALEGRDMLGIAQTGTGKTAAFMLPSIDRLTKSDRRVGRRSCRMLVLAPTRELAGQIAASARDYGALAGLSVGSIVGGTSVGRDRQRLAAGIDILVATPGRLIDMLDQKALVLNEIEILVLDEADQMLDLGFIHALRQIVALLPKQRQTLLFSATMPKTIRQLADNYLKDPVQVSVTPAATTVERVSQYVSHVNQAEKQALLTLALRKGLASDEIDRVLVFTRTKHGADRVVKFLTRSNIPSAAIHGNKSQPQRERALADFRQGTVRVLVATDIAARGIDVSGVSHVFNFELPNVAEQYVHRIGRTGRAGAAGVALSFCAPDERDYLRDIEKLTRVKLTQVPLPEGLRGEVEAIAAAARAAPPERHAGGRPPRTQRGPAQAGRKPNPRSVDPQGAAKVRPRNNRPAQRG